MKLFDFIKLQYQMGKISESQVKNFVPRWISLEQVNEILGGETVGLYAAGKRN